MDNCKKLLNKFTRNQPQYIDSQGQRIDLGATRDELNKQLRQTDGKAMFNRLPRDIPKKNETETPLELQESNVVESSQLNNTGGDNQSQRQNESSRNKALEDVNKQTCETNPDDGIRSPLNHNATETTDTTFNETTSTELNLNSVVNIVEEESERQFDFKQMLSFFKNLEKSNINSKVSKPFEEKEKEEPVSDSINEPDIDLSQRATHQLPLSPPEETIRRIDTTRMFNYHELRTFWERQSTT